MKAPLNWLREYCDPPLNAAAVAERLTMTGTKVESIDHHGVGSPEHFLVGRVLEVRAHEDAQRLKVCTVDLGAAVAAGPATIVCGAPNVAAGQTVAVARPGAVMPDGSELQEATLRGVVSEGMILAESELELGGDGAGILVLDGLSLDAEFAPGTPLAELLPIATDVLELEITPNRPDCLGVYGVARELHAASGAPLAAPPWAQDPGSEGALEGAAIAVECPDLCRRFTARVFDEVAIGPSPPWLKARLSAAGQRPINNVVDITNYVMLATGQPMHAFDLERVAESRLVVRRARDGEQLETLDGQLRTLDQRTVVIEDGAGPTSIAGLMGGARSEVHAQTRTVLMEAATWEGPNIHASSWRLGLRSEASTRFEKGLQPEQCMHAQALAARLMMQLCDATLRAGTIDLAWSPAAPQRIGLREARVAAILGIEVARERQAEILERLDFGTEQAPGGLSVTVPALRRDDVTREVDLIEEVARIDGLERLPATLPARRGAAGMLSRAQRLRRAAEDALAGRGLYEIAGWSFASTDLLDVLRLPAGDEMRRVVRLSNPLAESHSIMRPTLLGSLLEAARHNVAHNGPDVALFESGTVFRAASDESGAHEQHAIAALLHGALEPRAWRGEAPRADFFAAKAVLEALLGRLGLACSVEPRRWPFLHPGRSAAVLPGALGFVGELHPLVAEAFDLERTAVFELDLGRAIERAPGTATFRELASVPPLRQDLAVALPREVAAQELLSAVRAAGGEMLEEVSVFDVYSGAQVGADRRSLALALTFRSPQRTLTDADVAPVREQIIAAVTKLGGELRA
jgi:phenylalanyl-tRNA synthetase beta chain